MDELLDVFRRYASIELKEEVARSFSLFDFFEYKPAYSILADVVITVINNQMLFISFKEIKYMFGFV